MDPTALLPSLTATPSPSAAGAAKPPDAGAEDFAALLLRAGEDPAKAAAPGMSVSLLGELPAPTGLPATAIPFAEDVPLPPVQDPVLPAAQVPLPTSEPGLSDLGLPGTPAGTDSHELDQPEAPADHATQEIPLAIPAATVPLPIPPPPPTMPGPSEQASATQAVTTVPAGGPGTTGESLAADSKSSPATAPAEEAQGSAKALAVGLPGAIASEPQPASKAGMQHGPQATMAMLAAAPAQTSPALPQTLPVAAPRPASSVTSEPAQAVSRDLLKPQQASRERPMAVAAGIGQATARDQATAKDQDTAAAAASGQPSPMPERISPALILAPLMPQRPAEPAKAQPAPPDPLQAMPSGLSPSSLTPAAPDSAAPVATASAAPSAPLPPPARQVAQVTIALAMGQGQAPRLTVALEPESLGRVEIRIERGAEGEAASVHVLAERPETLALLQRDARELDRTLAQAGIVVASGGTQFGLSSGNGGQPQEQRPQQQGSGQGGSPGGGHSGQASLAVTGPAQATLNALSLLDIAV
ncbi:flagellar hook-length control protein FliK [Belnapia moabensis]|uniref:flagellar hook-length control protein FliK n=1 Tax=Belnapia moabensis TaxID=365533 RepID=UPI0005B946D4|nr:flagellar hook-length control protein FliK [Belnapia moabensis]